MNNSKMRSTSSKWKKGKEKVKRRPPSHCGPSHKKYFQGSGQPTPRLGPGKLKDVGKVYLSSLDFSGQFLEEGSEETLEDGPDAEDEVFSRDNIQVLLRIRPRNFRERQLDSRTIVKALNSATILFDPKQEQAQFYFHGIKQKVYDYKQRPNKNVKFAFDHVFPPSQSNVQIFDNALKPIVNHVIRGFNCSVFAYGATGSGKTYTMLGSAENPGLTFLMAKELSQRIKEMANEFESEIVVSYLEVYNETIKDLLYPSGQLSIREDGLSGVNVPNLTMHKIKDTCDLLRMLSCGNNARTQHPTDHNDESSRSHAVFQVFVTLRKRITHLCLNYKLIKSKLVMVDLAGSERGSTTNSDCLRCREGGSINKSLLALGNCINALADGKKHIPYRDSKLTRLLKDSLGGNCKTLMIANVAPTVLNYDDSYNTLKYADRAKQIRVSMKKNVTLEPAFPVQLLTDLQSEICQLKLMLQAERETNFNLQKQKIIPLAHACSNTSSFVSISPAIHDPTILENFIQLLGQKKKLEEAHVDASMRAKESEWNLMWQRWKIDSLSILEGHDLDDQRSTYEKLKNDLENMNRDHEQYVDNVRLTKRLLDFNDKEIDLIEKNFVNTLNEDGPFLTLTLREFLFYKNLERELSLHKSIGHFHQQISTRIFDEFLQSEINLCDTLKLSQYLTKVLDKHGIPVRKKIDLDRGDLNGDLSRMSNFPCQESILTMIQMIRNPIVDYESSESRPCFEDKKNVEVGPYVGSVETFVSQSTFDPSSSESESVRSESQKDVSESIKAQTHFPLQPLHPHSAQTSARIEAEQSPSSDVNLNLLPVYKGKPENYQLPQTQTSAQSGQSFSARPLSKHQPPPTRPSSTDPPKSTIDPPLPSTVEPPPPPPPSKQSHPKAILPCSSSSTERKEPKEKKRRRKGISSSRRKAKSDYLSKMDYSGSLEKEQEAQKIQKESQLLTIFNEVKNKDAMNPLSPKGGIMEVNPMSPKLVTSDIGQVSEQTESPSHRVKVLSPRVVASQPRVDSTALREIPSTPVQGKRVKKLRRKRGKKSLKKSLNNSTAVKNSKNRSKNSAKHKNFETESSTHKSLIAKVPLKENENHLQVKPESNKTVFPVPATPCFLHKIQNTPHEPDLEVKGQVAINTKTQTGSSKPKKQNGFTSTQMFVKASPNSEFVSHPTTTLFQDLTPISRNFKEKSKTEALRSTEVNTSGQRQQHLPMFQKLISGTNQHQKLNTQNLDPKILEPPVYTERRQNSVSGMCKHDSKEDFWTNGMFIPSSVPESCEFSEDQFVVTDENPLHKFNAIDDFQESIEEQTQETDPGFKSFVNVTQPKDPKSSHIPRLLPPPRCPPRSPTALDFTPFPQFHDSEFIHHGVEKPVLIQGIRSHEHGKLKEGMKKSSMGRKVSGSGGPKVLKLSIKNLEARERGWNDNFWKTDSEVGVSGDGADTNCDEFKGVVATMGNNGPTFEKRFEENYGDHSHLIVQPPPGYKTKDTSYFTNIISRPPKPMT